MLPDGWNKRSVGKLCQSIVPGRNKPKSFTGTIPWVTTPEIQGRYIPSALQVNYVSDTEIQEAGAKVIPIGSIVIAAVGDLGLVTIANERVVLNQQLHAFVCPDGFDNEYLAYYLETQKPYMESVASKTTIMYMNKSNCESIPIAYPLYSEQKKIAKTLSTWDRAITTTEHLITNSQQQKKALMQQLLTGKKRMAGFSGEWEEVQLGNCSKCLDNKRIPLNSEQRSKKQGKYPYWGANGILDYVDDFIFNEAIVLLAEDGGYFDEFATRPIANISYGKAWVNNHAHILIANDNISSEWLYYSLVHKNILGFVNSGTRAKLNKKDMLLIPILLPSIKEQQKITQVLSSADQEVETLQQKLNFLKEEKKALMQQLLTGKRRVKV